MSNGDLVDASTVAILLNNLRLLASKNRGRHLPLTAGFMEQAADVIDKLMCDMLAARADAEGWKETAYAARSDAQIAEEHLARLQASTTIIGKRTDATSRDRWRTQRLASVENCGD